MLEHEHTGDAMDSLIPRSDHWVFDRQTRDLCYNQFYRRGAEISQASVTSWLGIPSQLAFTVLSGACIFALILSIPVVARIALGLPAAYAIGAQGALALSAYLALLFVQGSLANLCSVGMFLAANGLTVLAVQRKSRRYAILTGILSAGVLIFYSDVALPVYLIPTGIALAYVTVRDRRASLLRARILLARNVVISMAVCAIVAHQAIESTILATWSHVELVSASDALNWNFSAAMSRRLSAAMGVFSYYENSAANSLFERWVDEMPWIFLGLYSILTACACSGYFKCRKEGVLGLAAVIAVLAPLNILFDLQADTMRFQRTSGYLWVYLLLGMVCAIYYSRGALRATAAALSLVLLVLNARTTLLFYDHVHRYDMSTESLYRRFDPRDPIWEKLRQRIATPGNSPVLISGCTNSIEPQWIVSGIEPIPNFLGSDIQAWWDIMQLKATGIYGVGEDDFGFRDGPEKKNLFKLKFPDWKVVFPSFVQRSEFAIVPPGGDYPVDWEAWRDVLPARRISFQRIGDVLYKTEKALNGADGGLSELMKDARGSYRVLNERTGLRVRDVPDSDCELRILFDGTSTDLTVSPARSVAYECDEPERCRLSAVIAPDQVARLSIEGAKKGVKIRKMEWVRLNEVVPRQINRFEAFQLN